MSNFLVTGATDKIDPVSRIEGHLGVEVKVAGDKITDAFAIGNMWRGFENFMLGREMNDAITFVQRICGVCPVPHGLTATYAADGCLGYSKGHITFESGSGDGYGVPKAAVLIRNLIYGSELMMSSITHFYHLAAPSYVKGPGIPPWTPYFADTYYHPALGGKVNIDDELLVDTVADIPGDNNDSAASLKYSVWQAVIASYVKALAMRRKIFEATAQFAGRMPMTSSFVAGGVTNNFAEAKAAVGVYKTLMTEVQDFVKREYVPIALALGVLYPEYDNVNNAEALGKETLVMGIGAGTKRYLSWGGLPDGENLMIDGGIKDLTSVDPDFNFTVSNKAEVISKFIAEVPLHVTEGIASSWYGDDKEEFTYDKAWPGAVTVTQPDREKVDAYSWMKSPRWDGKPCEVGPLARMMVSGKFVDGTPLATSLGAAYAQYVNTIGSVSGLKPSMVAPGIATALVRAGLATLTVVGAGSGGSDLVIDKDTITSYTDVSLIADVYDDVKSCITGAITTWVLAVNAGASTMDRLRARALECLLMSGWVLGFADELKGMPENSKTYIAKTGKSGNSWGAVEAPRGALMHTASTDAKGRITAYQCIVPTTWNGGPGDAGGKGPFEAAIIGAPFVKGTKVITGPSGASLTTVGDVEVLRICQSFDPCIACAVH